MTQLQNARTGAAARRGAASRLRAWWHGRGQVRTSLPGASPAFSRRLGAGLLAAMLAVLGGGVSVFLAIDYQATEAQVLRETGVLADALGAQTGGLVGGLDQALLGIGSLAANGALPPAAVVATLATRESALPDGVVLAVLERSAEPSLATAAGRRRLAGVQSGALQRSLAELPPLPPGRLAFLPPVRSIAGSMLPIVQMVEDGRVALALLPLRLLETFPGRLALSPGGAALIADESGRMLARIPPPPPERIGEPVPRAALFTRLLALGESWTGRYASPIDGVLRYTALRPVPGQPMVVAVGVKDSEPLAQWRRRAWLAGSLTALAVMAAGAGLVLVGREARRRLDAQAAASARLELLARGSAGIAAMAELPALLGHVGRMARETLAVPYACIALHDPARDGGQHAVSLAPAGGWFRPVPAPWQGTPQSQPRLPGHRAQAPAPGTEPPAALLATLEAWATDPALAAGGPGPRLFPAEPLLGLPARAAIALRDEQARPLGTLAVSRADDAGFSADDAAMLSQLGRMAGIAIRNRALIAGMQRAAEEARTARERIERLLESVSDGFLALDASWNVTYANAAALRLVRRRLNRVVGRSLWELYPVLVELEAFEHLHAVASLGQPREFEQHFPEAGRWFKAYAFTAADGVAVFFSDVTETRQTQELMRQSQRMEAVGRLTGSVAHDFNNLLAVIMGNAEMLEDSLEHDPENRHAAWLIRDAGDRGAALVRRLLAFASHQPQAIETVQPEALLEGLMPLLRRSVGNKVKVELTRQDDLPLLRLDPGQAENALLNLAINARDAMPEGGNLAIAVSADELDELALDGFPDARPGRFLRIDVSDTGTGMTPEVLARAAEPFFSTKGDGQGSGLGLASVYSFVRQTGGAMRLESQPGEGTRVTLLLPAAPATAPLPQRDAPQPDPALPHPPPPGPLHGGTEHVLLVEDEVSLRLNLTQQLSRIGYRVSAFGCGPSAIEALEDGLRPDVLLSDVIMPGGISGPRLAGLARTHLPDLPVLLMSGYALAPGDEDPALPLVIKPCPQAVLARRLRGLLDNR